MLKRVERVSHQAATGYDVEIAAMATAVPQYAFSQADALDRARYFLPRLSHMSNVFANTGVETRYSCVPMSWYKAERGWKESNDIYREQALDLLEDTARRAMADAGLQGGDVDAIVSVSTTGLAVPSLDALLSNRKGLSQNAERTPIFGLGCAGGTGGLARASRIAHTMPGGNVLLLVVELVGVNIQVNNDNPALFVSAALFGDGAACVVLRNSRDRHGGGSSSSLARVVVSGEHQWRDSGYLMGWEIGDRGFDVVLSSALPDFARKNLRPAAEAFLERHGLEMSDIDGYIFHPGGPKVLEATADALGLEPAALDHARDILNRYGNMSAPTVLFVLEQTIRSGARGRHLMASFGPAFTVTFAVLDL